MHLTLFERGLVAHIVADWLLQTDWMARNKTRLNHAAAWVHAAIHTLCLTWALGWHGGVVLGIVHLLIDTRVPLEFWVRFVTHSDNVGDTATTRLWLDQAMHVVAIALWVQLAPH